MLTPKLIICGSIAIDRIMNFSGQYRDLIDATKLEVLSVSVLVQSFDVAEGGTGGNIAHNVALLGDHPALLSSVGADASAYTNRLRTLGVDTSNVHVSSAPTASFNVLTDSTGNQVGGFYPGAMEDAASLSLLPFAGQPVFVCLAAHDPNSMRRQTDECKQHAIRLFYDPGQQVSNISDEDLKAGIEAAEVLIVNDYELSLLAKKTGWSETQLQAKVSVLITTHGKHGSVIYGPNSSGPIRITSVKPEQIVDPTGAGDAYRAGFVYGYLRQWELVTCGQLGSVVASFALEQHGPQANFSKESIKQRYHEAYNQEIEL